jgi:hypothetical protein
MKQQVGSLVKVGLGILAPLTVFVVGAFALGHRAGVPANNLTRDYLVLLLAGGLLAGSIGMDLFIPNSEIGMGSAAAPAAVRRALAPNSEASDHPKRLEHFAHPSEPRGRGSLRPRRARSPKSTSEFGLNAA